jgi:hypothetical protein
MAGPHDRFFRYIFNSPARAEALLRHNLPAQLANEVDWSTLRRESGTLVVAERETRNDLLFSARPPHGGEDLPPHYFIIEHESSVPRWMALRLHDYSSPLAPTGRGRCTELSATCTSLGTSRRMRR